MAQWEQIQLGTMRWQVRFLTLLSGLRIRRCRELWYGLQTWLGSRVAVALAKASSCSSDLTPSLGTSICCGCGPRKDRKRKEKKRDEMKGLR